MPRMKKSLMRGLAPSVLADRGLKEVRARSSRGLLPGARLSAKLKKRAVWSVRLSAEEVRARTSAASGETFYERVKREFAERNGVDVSQVEVEFRIKS